MNLIPLKSRGVFLGFFKLEDESLPLVEAPRLDARDEPERVLVSCSGRSNSIDWTSSESGEGMLLSSSIWINDLERRVRFFRVWMKAGSVTRSVSLRRMMRREENVPSVPLLNLVLLPKIAIAAFAIWKVGVWQ